MVDQLKAIYQESLKQPYPREKPEAAELVAEALNNQAVSLLDLGRPKEAERLFRKALEADPHQLEATYNLGLFLWRSGRMTDDRLVSELQEVRTTHEEDWRDEYLLGLVHLERGNIELAVDLLAEAARASQENPEVAGALKKATSSLTAGPQGLRMLKGHTDQVLSIAFTPDGRRAVSVYYHKNVCLWDLDTGQCLGKLEGHTFKFGIVGVTPDGQRAVSANKLSGIGQNCMLRLWELATGRCLRTLEERTDSLTLLSVAISANGVRAVFSTGFNTGNTIGIWDIDALLFRAPYVAARAQRAEKVLSQQKEFASHLAAAAAHLKGGEYRSAHESLKRSRQVRGRARDEQALKLWEELGPRARRCGLRGAWLLRTLEGNTKGVPSIATTPDGRHAVSATGDHEVRLWDLDTGQCLWTLGPYDSLYPSVAITPDGQRAVFWGHDTTIRLYGLRTGRGLRELEGHTSFVLSVAFSPDGRFWLSGSKDNTLRLWDASTGQCVRTFEGHTNYVMPAAFGPDGRFCLSGSNDNTLRLWDTSTGQCVRTFEGHTNTVNHVAFGPDGRLCLSGSMDSMTRLWDTSTGQCVRTFKPRPLGYRVTLSPDGRRAVAWGFCEPICIWELGSGQCQRTPEGKMGFRSGAVSADCRQAVSASSDSMVRLWDLDTGQCLRTLEGHTLGVTSVAITPDGRRVVSGSRDNTIRLWYLDWDHDFPEPADWDDGAQPYLETFLTLRTPHAGRLPKDRKPTEKEIAAALTRRGRPKWNDKHFEWLINQLRDAGYGWLRPEGVRRELKKMTRKWKGPPPLPGE